MIATLIPVLTMEAVLMVYALTRVTVFQDIVDLIVKWVKIYMVMNFIHIIALSNIGARCNYKNHFHF